MALELPEVREGLASNRADLFRGDRHMARLREEGRAVAIRLPWERVDELLDTQSDVFFVTPHYTGWPYVLAWLDKLDANLARELVQSSWSIANERLPVRKAGV